MNHQCYNKTNEQRIHNITLTVWYLILLHNLLNEAINLDIFIGCFYILVYQFNTKDIGQKHFEFNSYIASILSTINSLTIDMVIPAWINEWCGQWTLASSFPYYKDLLEELIEIYVRLDQNRSLYQHEFDRLYILISNIFIKNELKATLIFALMLRVSMII